MNKQYEEELIEIFNWTTDESEKYDVLIDFGKQLPVLENIHKIEENIVKGCQSKVWVIANKIDDKIYFKGDSNTVITKGLVAILINIYSGLKKDEILNMELDIFIKIGLRKYLSSQRNNGLNMMVKKMIELASNL